MFRQLRRIKQEISKETCIKVLKEEKRAVLAVNGDEGYPYCLPINYYYDETENKIYFHSGKNGHKIDSIKNDDKVCFSVHDLGEKREDWSYYVNSVIIFGRARIMEDGDKKLEMAKEFARKYFPSEEDVLKEIEHGYSRMELVCIEVEHTTGKLVHEK